MQGQITAELRAKIGYLQEMLLLFIECGIYTFCTQTGDNMNVCSHKVNLNNRVRDSIGGGIMILAAAPSVINQTALKCRFDEKN